MSQDVLIFTVGTLLRKWLVYIYICIFFLHYFWLCLVWAGIFLRFAVLNVLKALCHLSPFCSSFINHLPTSRSNLGVLYGSKVGHIVTCSHFECPKPSACMRGHLQHPARLWLWLMTFFFARKRCFLPVSCHKHPLQTMGLLNCCSIRLMIAAKKCHKIRLVMWWLI